MYSFLQKTKKTVCFLLIAALVCVYMPMLGIADKAYADAPSEIVITLGTDVDAVNTTISNAGLGTQMSYRSSGSSRGGGIYTLTLDSVSNSAIKLVNALPAPSGSEDSVDAYNLNIVVRGRCTIGEISTSQDVTRPRQISIVRHSDATGDCELNLSRIIDRGPAARAIARNYPRTLEIKGSNNERRLFVEVEEITMDVTGDNPKAEILAPYAYLSCDSLSLGNAETTFAAHATNAYTAIGEFSFGEVTFGKFISVEPCNFSARKVLSTNNLSTPGSDYKDTFELFGGNVNINEELKTDRLLIKNGNAYIGGSLAGIKNVYFVDAGLPPNAASVPTVHSNATSVYDAVINNDSLGAAGGNAGTGVNVVVSYAGIGGMDETTRVKTQGPLRFEPGREITLSAPNAAQITTISGFKNKLTNLGRNENGIRTTFVGQHNPIYVSGKLADGYMIGGARIGAEDGYNAEIIAEQYDYDEESGVIEFDLLVDPGDFRSLPSSSGYNFSLSTAASDLVKVEYHLPQQSMHGAGADYEVLHRGERVKQIELYELMGASRNMDWYLDAACTVPFDTATPITTDTAIYGSIPSVPVSGEINIEPVTICSGSDFDDLKGELSGSDYFAFNSARNVFAMPQSRIYAVASGTAASYDASTLRTVSYSDTTSRDTFTGAGNVYFALFSVNAMPGYELATGFRVKYGGREISPVNGMYLCPITVTDCNLLKVKMQDGASPLWYCPECNSTYTDAAGSTRYAAAVTPRYKDIASDLTSSGAGIQTLTLSEDTAYLLNARQNGTPTSIAGDLIIDLDGHELYADRLDIAGNLTVKNGKFNAFDITAGSITLDNAVTQYEDAFDDENCAIAGDIELKNGSVWEVKNLGYELYIPGNLIIDGTSVVKLYMSDIGYTIAESMGSLNYTHAMHSETVGKIRNYISTGTRIVDIVDVFPELASNMGNVPRGQMFLLQPGEYPAELKNWPASGRSGGSRSENTVAGATTTDVTTNADGSTTTTTVAADGSTGTVAKDNNGNITAATAEISEKATSEAAKSGEAVTLPIEVKATAERGAAAKVEIKLPSTVTKEAPAKVEIPVENMTAGTVAVLVDADGNEQIIKTCEALEGGIAVELTGDATIKIVENSKEFTDVKAGNWAADPIQFVVSREIFNGTSASTFDPDVNMSRGMVAQVICNFADGTGKGGAFTDAEGKWYDSAASWVLENGIMTGVGGNSFAGEAYVSREQLATTFYRLAILQGKVKVGFGDGKLSAFSDAASISEFAKEALAWATAEGLILGNGGKIEPKGLATRAQVAAIMQRYCGL